MNFKELKINDNLINILSTNGIKTPTPIQSRCIPSILSNKDVIGEAQTGTGKTLAFLIPIFEKISPTNSYTQVLIISPTRELAIQITDEAIKLNKNNEINILLAYGGKDIGSQLKKLKKSPQIIIATPGRLLDHIKRNSIKLNALKTLVIDEADQMLLMGFKNEIEEIMKYTNKDKQVLCFSATLDPKVKKLAFRYMNNPDTISIKDDTVTDILIKQEIIESSDRWKQDCLFKALEEDNPFIAIIFCRTKRRADELQVGLHKKGIKCEKIHSDIPQNKRERIMKSFRNADIQYLIATDVVSRGIDVSGVTHIYNYDVPETPESYIHRIGRTGRAGDSGYTCMFVTPKNQQQLIEIEQKLGYNIPKRNIVT